MLWNHYQLRALCQSAELQHEQYSTAELQDGAGGLLIAGLQNMELWPSPRFSVRATQAHSTMGRSTPIRGIQRPQSPGRTDPIPRANLDVSKVDSLRETLGLSVALRMVPLLLVIKWGH